MNETDKKVALGVVAIIAMIALFQASCKKKEEPVNTEVDRYIYTAEVCEVYLRGQVYSEAKVPYDIAEPCCTHEYDKEECLTKWQTYNKGLKE